MPQQFDDAFDEDGDQLDEELDLSEKDGNDDDSPPEDRGDELTEGGARPDASEQQQPPEVAEQQAKPPAMIPKARFDEVNQRKKELEAELERVKAEQSKRINLDADIEELEGKYNDLLLEGETEQAKALRMQINQKLVENSVRMVAQQVAQEQQQTEIQAAAVKVIDSYPYLDTPDGEFAMGLIIGERNRLIASGKHPAAAIQEAAEKIAPRFAPENQPIHNRGTTHKPQMVDSRTKGAVTRGLQDSARQPVAPQGVGNRAMPSLPSSVEDMDEEQFASLTKEQKRRLRGD